MRFANCPACGYENAGRPRASGWGSIGRIMQQLVGLALEEAVVEGHNHGVLIGLLDNGHIVGAVDALGPGRLGADSRERGAVRRP